MEVLGSRGKPQPAPAKMVFESLTQPHRPGGREWLLLTDSEIAPNILVAEEPHTVIWSTLWPNRPNDEIHFAIEPLSDGCALTWTLMSPEVPDASHLGHLRYRLNTLINGHLRYSYGQ